MIQNANLDLVAFVEQQILPRYATFDKAHGLIHVQRVINNSLELAQITGANRNMVYTVAAYHDLGMEGPRAIHHLTGGKILQNDARLRKWFSAEQIRIMREAVEDHRASSSRTPRSIYGKIIAEADRDLEPEIVFTRAIQFAIENSPNAPVDKLWQQFKRHIHEKYGRNGYISLWIPNSPNARKLENIRFSIDNEETLKSIFDRIYLQETSHLMNDEQLMQRAIELSIESVANGGGPFGALIARNGEIIAEASNSVTLSNDPTAHAEVSAIRKACQNLGTFNLSGCVIFTSCEPCPMCLGAIYWARLDKIFYANTRKDAAAIGFDDEFLYKELALQPQYRSKPSETIMRSAALVAFEQWQKKSDKTEY